MSALVRIPLGVTVLFAWMSVAFGYRPAPLPEVVDLEPAPVTAIPLVGETLYDGEVLAMPAQIAVVGDRIVLVDGFAERPIHVLDRVSGAHLADLGRGGEGPGEFEWPRYVEADLGRDDAFWVYDAALSRLTLVEPAEWVTRPASERRTLPIRTPAQVTNIVRLGPDRLIAAGFFGEGRLGNFDGSGAYTGATGPIPTSVTAAPPGVLQHAYRGTLKPDPRRERLVFANRHAGFLEVYDASGELQRRIEGPHSFEPAFEVKAGPRGPGLATGDDLRFGYVDVAPTTDRVYALFSGRTRVGDRERATYGRVIHVFTWEGHLESVLSLDVDAMHTRGGGVPGSGLRASAGPTRTKRSGRSLRAGMVRGTLGHRDHP
jgi:hypothetical protein